MAAPSGNEILAYKGNADMGGGGSSAIPDFTLLNQTAKDFALLNFEKNQDLYEQRIKDRDALFAMVNDKKLIPENILEEHRPEVDGKMKKYMDMFYNNPLDIMNDPGKFRDFRSALSDAEKTIMDSQKRSLFIANELERLSSETSQFHKDQMIKNVEKARKLPLGETPIPYAKIIDFDLKVVQPDLVTTVLQDNLNDVTTVDIPKSLSMYRNNWQDDEGKIQFRNFINEVNGVPDPQKFVDEKNNALKAKAAASGIQLPAGLELKGAYDPQTKEFKFVNPDFEVAFLLKLADEEWKTTTLSESRKKISQEDQQLKNQSYSISVQKMLGLAGINARTQELIADMKKIGFIPDKNGNWVVDPDAQKLAPGEVPNLWSNLVGQLNGKFRNAKGDLTINPNGTYELDPSEISGLDIIGATDKDGKKTPIIGVKGSKTKISVIYKDGNPEAFLINGVRVNSTEVNNAATIQRNKAVNTKNDVEPPYGSGGPVVNTGELPITPSWQNY